MKKRTHVSIRPRLFLSSREVDDKLSDVCRDLEKQMYGRLESAFVDRREHHGTNDHLINAVDRWEDQNGWKRQGW